MGRSHFDRRNCFYLRSGPRPTAFVARSNNQSGSALPRGEILPFCAGRVHFFRVLTAFGQPELAVFTAPGRRCADWNLSGPGCQAASCVSSTTVSALCRLALTRSLSSPSCHLFRVGGRAHPFFVLRPPGYSLPGHFGSLESATSRAPHFLVVRWCALRPTRNYPLSCLNLFSSNGPKMPACFSTGRFRKLLPLLGPNLCTWLPLLLLCCVLRILLASHFAVARF